jgi:hypothetical protein
MKTMDKVQFGLGHGAARSLRSYAKMEEAFDSRCTTAVVGQGEQPRSVSEGLYCSPG